MNKYLKSTLAVAAIGAAELGILFFAKGLSRHSLVKSLKQVGKNSLLTALSLVAALISNYIKILLKVRNHKIMLETIKELANGLLFRVVEMLRR